MKIIRMCNVRVSHVRPTISQQKKADFWLTREYYGLPRKTMVNRGLSWVNPG
jgi:hypothetical protein